MGKPITIAVPSGIGDSLWSITKVPAIRREHPNRPVHLFVQASSKNRAGEFLERFSFIDRVSFREFPIQPTDEKIRSGRYVYLPSGKNVMGFDFYLIANGHLEQGGRLEDWFSEYETDFTIADSWKFDACDLEYAVSLGSYAVLYLGPDAGNFSAGHNRGHKWTLDQWVQVVDALKSKGVTSVLVGAPYDKEFSDKLVSLCRTTVIDLVGKTSISRLFALCKHSRVVLSYPSGIPVFSTYLRVPTVMWWSPPTQSMSSSVHVAYDRQMSVSWLPPEAVYRPCFYLEDTVDTVVSKVVEVMRNV